MNFVVQFTPLGVILRQKTGCDFVHTNILTRLSRTEQPPTAENLLRGGIPDKASTSSRRGPHEHKNMKEQAFQAPALMAVAGVKAAVQAPTNGHLAALAQWPPPGHRSRC